MRSRLNACERFNWEKFNMNEMFRRFAQATASVVGSSWWFLTAVAVVFVWGVLGPIYHFSDTWQLVINTVSSVITFLMVFLIQNTQNRDSKAIQLKLNELLRGVEGARTGLVNLESLSDDDLRRLQMEFERLAKAKVSAKDAPNPQS
jgi:low affinity Fe/Cu permease